MASDFSDTPSELQFERELEITHRVRPEIRCRVDAPQARTDVQLPALIERADERIGIAQVDVVEDVHHFDPELKLLCLGEAELFEERSVGAPITGAAHRVAPLIAKLAT